MSLAEQIAEFDRINRTRSLTDAESLALEKLVKQEFNTELKRRLPARQRAVYA